MKPPISYYGGKQRIASKIVPYIPKHTVYAEPYCGGATILFAKPWPRVSNTHNYREYINDTDERLINFYRVLQDEEKSKKLIRRLEFTLYSEAEHRKAKNLDDGTDIDRAWAYYVNVNQSFANKINAGWGRSVYGRNLQSTWIQKISRLPEYLNRMAAAGIASTPALKFIQQYDSPQTFFYIDPPYPETDQGHYKGFTIDDFNELTDLLRTIQGSFILSCYDFEGMRISDEWERVEIEAHCFASGKGKVNGDRSRRATTEELGDRTRTEILYIKQSEEPRDEIKKLYATGTYDCFTGDQMFAPGLFDMEAKR